MAGEHKRYRYPPPFSLRLTFEERSRLEREAGDMPLGAFIRERLFDGTVPPRRTRGKRPVKDHAVLARLLGELGRSHLASNLNQLARASNSGSLPVTAETEQALADACTDVREIRDTLLIALGLHGDAGPGEPAP
ncbi:hypothetical protein [uncultured Rhodospira sp.]|uniref:hypothetical protein n=1 Tax=uncultured Rhodospira sp. TaxID=1936189 RepID=UPI002630CF31|nr:hypothetical protein [uncultured Rhodospira sp.]